jgi:murein peptide amidase A
VTVHGRRLLTAILTAGTVLATAGTTDATTERSMPHSVIGHSVRGRPIEVRRIGDPKADLKVLVVGSIHGDETQGHRVVRRLRGPYGKRVKGADVWTITTVNPDGVAAGRRKNADGVDLNRNFSHDFDPSLGGGYNSGPHAFSEPESRAVARLSKRVHFDLAVWYHQPWGETLIPCNSTGRYARRYAGVSGLPASRGCDGYSPGSAISWQHHRFGTVAFVVELPGRRLHGAEVRRHARATVAVARMLR